MLAVHILLSVCGLFNHTTVPSCIAVHLAIIHLADMHTCVNYYQNQKQYPVTNLIWYSYDATDRSFLQSSKAHYHTRQMLLYIKCVCVV